MISARNSEYLFTHIYISRTNDGNGRNGQNIKTIYNMNIKLFNNKFQFNYKSGVTTLSSDFPVTLERRRRTTTKLKQNKQQIYFY